MFSTNCYTKLMSQIIVYSREWEGALYLLLCYCTNMHEQIRVVESGRVGERVGVREGDLYLLLYKCAHVI